MKFWNIMKKVEHIPPNAHVIVISLSPRVDKETGALRYRAGKWSKAAKYKITTHFNCYGTFPDVSYIHVR